MFVYVSTVPLINNSGASIQTFGESSTTKEHEKPKQCLVCADPGGK